MVYHFFSDLAFNKISTVRFTTPKHEYLTLNIYYTLNLKTKLYENRYCVQTKNQYCHGVFIPYKQTYPICKLINYSILQTK